MTVNKKTIGKWWHRWKNYFLWFLVNGVFCQIPHTLAYFVRNEDKFFFPSGMTYLFTLFVTSAYVASTIKAKNTPSQAMNKSILSVIAMIILVVLTYILATYPDIKNPYLYEYLVMSPINSYFWIMIALLLAAFWISKSSLDELIKTDLDWIANEKGTNQRMKENLDKLKGEDFK